MFEKVRDIISYQLDVDADVITPETDIAEDLGADSLDVVELLTSLEDEFSIVIPQDAVQEIKTVGDLADYLDKLI